MNRNGWLVLIVIVALAGWWGSPHSPRRARVQAAAFAGTSAPCPPPAPAPPLGEPLQSAVPADLAPFRLRPATLTPLAGFSVDARVLSRHDYDSGREADLSPTDLALGWSRMRDDRVVSRLDISQAGRWYHYRWSGNAPIAPDEIARSSANMHLIPANADAARELSRVAPGQRVRFDGWLVEARTVDGWTWRSSTTRNDTGEGACEVVYVCSMRRY